MTFDCPRPGMLPQLKALWREAFGDEEDFIAGFFAAAFSPGRCLCAWEGDRVLAAAYWMDCGCQAGRLAYIYAVVTKREARGRGLCHALMDKIHERLTARGYAGAVLVPGEPSLGGFYEKMGYRFFGGRQELTVRAGKEPLALRQLSPMEFARLRRELLPPGGIRQEGEGLRFLARHYRFGAGDGVLLAYTLDDGVLFAPELLGDEHKAPGILKALGAEKGTFRLAGKDPFAMHKPLCAAEIPTYFGFAFD